MKRGIHLPALDGLRGLAILLVIPHNANLYSEHPGVFWPLAIMANAGWIGVQLFFVLSGFLITGGLLQMRTAPHYFRNFYLRRALRIMPLYYVVLLAGLLAGPALIDQPPLAAAERSGVPWLWLFLSNWVQPFGLAVPGFSHFWSLAVEEQFYLLWPLAIVALSERGIARLCIVLVVAAAAVRLLLPAFGAPLEASYVLTTCRMDALAVGALAALLHREPRAQEWLAARAPRLTAAAVAMLLAAGLATRLYDRHDWRTLAYGEPLLALSFAALLLTAATPHPARRWQRALAWPPLRAIGRYSYGMYVLHLPIILAITAPANGWMTAAGRAGPPLFTLLAVLLSVMAGWLSYVLLERRCLALKDRFAPPAAGMRPSSTGAQA